VTKVICVIHMNQRVFLLSGLYVIQVLEFLANIIILRKKVDYPLLIFRQCPYFFNMCRTSLEEFKFDSK